MEFNEKTFNKLSPIEQYEYLVKLDLLDYEIPEEQLDDLIKGSSLPRLLASEKSKLVMHMSTADWAAKIYNQYKKTKPPTLKKPSIHHLVQDNCFTMRTRSKRIGGKAIFPKSPPITPKQDSVDYAYVPAVLLSEMTK